MDNDDDDFNYDLDPIHMSPFPDDCRNEVHGIESLQICFMNRYNACPAFFMGSLRNACQKAIHSSRVKERCPVLVYIHHDDNLFSNIFCWNVFCTEMIIEYLLDNYIVWPFDITHESNKNRLMKIWKEIFPTEVSLDFTVQQCPMLIGIMRRSAKEKDGSSSSEYEFLPLLKGDTLTRTQEKFSPKSVFKELSKFREECDENEQALSCELITKTGLSGQIIVEICKYLSLNDAINAFSTDILFFLRQSKAKVHMDKPCDQFFHPIIQKIEPVQIVSLCLNTDERWLQMVFTYLPIFKQVISLTLLNLQLFEQLNEYEIHFPKLTCLSLRYDNEIGFNILENLFYYLPKSIRRLKVRCAGALCPHYEEDDFYLQGTVNFSVKYFLLDVSQSSSIPTNECFQRHQSCFMMTTMDLVKNMANIRYFRLVVNQRDLEKLLNINAWTSLVCRCYILEKVKLEVVRNTSRGETLLSQIVMKIQNELRSIREKVKFQVTFI